jgi:4-hydroxybenzoate polyprenyltransferase
MTNSRYCKSPLVVDLDGTLIRTDILWESLLLLIKKKPKEFLVTPLWLLKGKSFFKRKLADNVTPDVTVLPYYDEVINLLYKSKKEGKTLILASASDERIVKKIAHYLNLFDIVLGTTDNNNLKGVRKLELIKQTCNGQVFDYIGNEKADIPLWYESEKAYVVTNSQKLINSINKESDKIYVFRPPGGLKSLIKALRPHQWAKNILLFIPFFLAHEIMDYDKIITLILCFIMMSLCASSVYVINDLLDLESDRHHSSKKNRPFAAGFLSIPNGMLLSAVLLLLSFVVSYIYLPHQFTALLALYLIITMLYSFLLKRFLLADVIGLSSLYTLRIFAGGVAVTIPLSPWLLAFSSFFFLNLGLLKRYVELKEYEFRDKQKLKGRNYLVDDMHVILSSGISSGYMSVLIYYLYITNSPKVIQLYSSPEWLWFIGPLLIYWITRLWLLAQRKHVDSDPVLFAIKDYTSWIIGLIILIIMLFSI